MIFLSYFLLAAAVFSGVAAGILTSWLSGGELAASRRWLVISRKIFYILFVATALFFLAQHWLAPVVVFFGVVCAQFRKIFNSPHIHLFAGFLFFIAARDVVFLLTLSTVLFLFYFVCSIFGIAGFASLKISFRKKCMAVIIHHLPFFICLPLYVFYL